MTGRNSEGYSDPTAVAAVSHATKEEHRRTDLMRALRVMHTVADVFGFRVVGRITMKDKRTGHIFKCD